MQGKHCADRDKSLRLLWAHLLLGSGSWMRLSGSRRQLRLTKRQGQNVIGNYM